MTNSPPPSSVPPQLLHLIATLCRELHGRESTVRPDSRLDADLGLDSLARVELAARIERELGLQAGSAALATETPQALWAALRAATGEGNAVPTGLTLPASMPETTCAPPIAASTLLEVLDWHATRQPERPHVRWLEEGREVATLSYGQLQRDAQAMSDTLAARGIGPGHTVALMLPSSLDFLRAFFAILFCGAIPVPIYPPWRAARLEDHLRRQAGILASCQAVALIGDQRLTPLAKLLGAIAPEMRHVLSAEALAAAGPKNGALPTVSAEHLALLQYTSGSTGEPKGVMLNHTNLLANIRAWGQALALTRDDVAVSWLPLYHDLGLIGAWLGSLYHGCPLVLMSPLDFLARPRVWFETLDRYRGTISAAPNFAWALMLREVHHLQQSGLDLSALRYLANGAEPISAATLEAFATAYAPLGIRRQALAPVYGLAENTVGLAVTPPGREPLIVPASRTALQSGHYTQPQADDDRQLIVGCGQPLPGHQIRIVDPHGRPLPEGQIGELQFRGPSACGGYYRDPEASAALKQDGWLRSGDLAFMLGNELFIHGRSKEIIIRAGRNIAPYEIEEAIGQLSGVRRGCVVAFGVPDAVSGSEKLIIAAETRLRDATRRDQLSAEIRRACSELEGLPADEVLLLPPHALAKTSSGKLRRAAIRAAYLDGTLGRRSKSVLRQIVRLSGAALGHKLAYFGHGLRAWLAFFLLLLPALVAMALPGLSRRWRALHLLAQALPRLAGWPLEIIGPAPTQRGVLVANHASYLDALLLMAALPEPVSFATKRELKATPLGPLLQRLGVVFVERQVAELSLAAYRELTAVAQSQPVAIFAEGTFSALPGLRRFRLGAFRLAAEAGLPVFPISIAGSRRALPAGRWWPSRQALRITWHPPLSAQGATWPQILALRDQTRRLILSALDEADLAAHASVGDQ